MVAFLPQAGERSGKWTTHLIAVSAPIQGRVVKISCIFLCNQGLNPHHLLDRGSLATGLSDVVVVTQRSDSLTHVSARGRLVKDKSTKELKLNCRKYAHLCGTYGSKTTDCFVAGSAASLFLG